MIASTAVRPDRLLHSDDTHKVVLAFKDWKASWEALRLAHRDQAVTLLHGEWLKRTSTRQSAEHKRGGSAGIQY